MDVSLLYSLEVPSYNKYEGIRGTTSVWVCPPHEALSAEVRADSDLRDDLARRVDNTALPPFYCTHPVFEKKGDLRARPIVLYMDSTPYTLSDSCLAIFVYNLLTGKRNMAVAFRRRDLCRCGCRGWCSLWVTYDWLAHSFRHLATGC